MRNELIVVCGLLMIVPTTHAESGPADTEGVPEELVEEILALVAASVSCLVGDCDPPPCRRCPPDLCCLPA